MSCRIILLSFFFLFFQVALFAQNDCFDIVLTSQAEVDDFELTCDTIYGDLTISSNEITDLSKFLTLKRLEGELMVEKNDKPNILDAFANLEYVHKVDLFSLTISNLAAFQSLNTVQDRLAIRNNDLLVDISLLNQVDLSMLSSLFIYHNDNLWACNVDPICDLLEVDFFLPYIQANGFGCDSNSEIISSCHPDCLGNVNVSTQNQIDNLSMPCDTFYGDLTISSNEITDLSKFTAIKVITGKLTVENNDQPSILEPFAYLESVGVLELERLAISDLAAFQSLTNIQEALRVSTNDLLVDISLLDEIDLLGLDYLRIYNNDSLSVCSYEQICTILELGLFNVYVSSNAPGCISNVEVLAGCHAECLGTVNLSTQDQVDALVIPCDTIYGNVVISGDVSDLSIFSTVKHILGYLSIREAESLTDLTGLESLEVIEGGLVLSNCSNLNDLSALSNLEKLHADNGFGGGLSIEGLAIENLDFFENLKEITDNINIEKNYLLSDISSLESVNIDGVYYMNIRDNPLLSECNYDNFCAFFSTPSFSSVHNNGFGCQSIEEINLYCSSDCVGDIFLETQQQVLDFELLCDTIYGDLSITSNNVYNLSKFSNLKRIEGTLSVSNNSFTDILSHFKHLEYVGGLVLDNLIIQNLDDFERLHTIATHFDFSNNFLLDDISLIETVDISLIDYLRIRSNPMLTVCAYENICTAVYNETSTIVWGNGAGCENQEDLVTRCIPSCSSIIDINIVAQQQLDDLIFPCDTLFGDLTITSNNVSDLSKFSRLKRIEGVLQISNNSDPDILSYFDSLEYVDGIYFSNLKIETLDGLTNLECIENSIYFLNNDKLTDISALASMNLSNLNSLRFYYNAQLSECSYTNICSILLNTSVFFSNNGEGCSSLDEVVFLCDPDCFGNVFLSSQATLDSFNLHCDTIYGDLIISSNEIYDLSKFSNLKRIEGTLTIKDNNQPNILSYFDSLEYVNSLIFENLAITDLNDLEQLKKINFEITLRNNDLLEDISAIENIDISSVYALSIENNPSLSWCSYEAICSKIPTGFWELRINNNGSSCENVEIVQTGCLNNCIGSYTFNSQELVDSFTIVCDTIFGNLTIKSNNIFDLENLSSVKVITGNMTISGNSHISNLDAFSNLESIGNNLSLINLDSLESLEGLSSIKSLNNLEISFHQNLINLKGLSQLNRVNELTIQYCDNLENLEGLTGLDTIGELVILSNPNLTNLDGLNQLNQVKDLTIQDCEKLTDISALSNLTVIDGDLSLDNSILENLDALSTLEQINGEITLSENDFLTSILGLEELDGTTITGLHITQNPQLSNCSIESFCTALANDIPTTISQNGLTCKDLFQIQVGCGQAAAEEFCNFPLYEIESQAFLDQLAFNLCDSIFGDVLIETDDFFNDPIVDFSAFMNLKHIGGKLIIRNNEDLVSLEGLNHLRKISQEFIISNCPNLESLEGLESLQQVGSYYQQVGSNAVLRGGLTINNCDQLLNIKSLEKLKIIEGDLIISNNATLTSFNGLENLHTVGGRLSILINPALTSLEGFDAIQNLNKQVFIEYNNQLQSLEGIENANLESVTQLRINGNPKLEYCELDNICTYLESDKNRLIQGNSLRCINDDVIVTACSGVVCLPTNLIFTAQKELDDFLETHATCTDILGDVWIRNESILDPITKLDGLQNITRIEGDLLIEFHKDLVDWSGLSALRNIGGDFIFRYNRNIPQLEGLENLIWLGGNLIVWGNEDLMTLQNFTTIQHIGGDISLLGNPDLMNVNGFEGLEWLSGSLLIESNASLANLSGLNQLESVDGDVVMASNSSLTQLNGLQNLKEVKGKFSIVSNPSLTNLIGLTNLERAAVLEIHNNENLLRLDGLNSLWRAKVDLFNNNQLVDIRALESMDYFPPYWPLFDIQGNDALSDCAIAIICELIEAGFDAQVIVLNNGPACSSIPALSPFCTTSLMDDIQQNDFSIYPNPSQGTVWVRHLTHQKGKFILYNSKGTLVQMGEFDASFQLDLQQFNAGIYFLKLQGETFQHFAKVVLLRR